MEIRIYQRKQHQQSHADGAINQTDYIKVFEGHVHCTTLEGVYTMFNLFPPAGYYGMGFSTSDVVQIMTAKRIHPGYYY